jgi:hypothetical protein
LAKKSFGLNAARRLIAVARFPQTSEQRLFRSAAPAG